MCYFVFENTVLTSDELHETLKEVTNEPKCNVEAFFHHFLKYYKEKFPHYFYDEKLKQISDLRNPAHWFPQARKKKRKIIFHAGPTNSGKTYHAMKRFLSAESGIYCSPLRLLANEIYHKSNSLSIPCDLLTGENRNFAKADGTLSSHLACVIEMAPLHREYDVAIIDEVQSIRDRERGRAWVRAVLGLCANEIHLCGESVAIDIVTRICETLGETVEVKTYERLTKLSKEDTALRTLDNVQPGDCIVCFQKDDIYRVSRELELRGKEVAILYGTFNDPEDSCKVMVATDAIGTGINLCIRRIIFYLMKKICVNRFGERKMQQLSVSATLQIAGRAGRYGTKFDHGFVTTFREKDMPILTSLLAQQPEAISRAGLAPNISQIEKYAELLPNLHFCTVLNVFESHVTFNNDLYFICDITGIKEVTEYIDHIQLELSDRYIFCCAPIEISQHVLIQRIFVQFVELYSKNEVVGTDWIHRECGYPFSVPNSIHELKHWEIVHEICNCYLWLSFRFPRNFTEADEIRKYQKELDAVISKGLSRIKKSLLEETHETI